MKVLYIVLANLALPFLIFYLRNVIYKAYYVWVLKDKEKPVPSLDFALAFRLICCGVILLGLVLVYFRIQAPLEQRTDGLQVQQYNLR